MLLCDVGLLTLFRRATVCTRDIQQLKTELKALEDVNQRRYELLRRHFKDAILAYEVLLQFRIILISQRNMYMRR